MLEFGNEMVMELSWHGKAFPLLAILDDRAPKREQRDFLEPRQTPAYKDLLQKSRDLV